MDKGKAFLLCLIVSILSCLAGYFYGMSRSGALPVRNESLATTSANDNEGQNNGQIYWVPECALGAPCTTPGEHCFVVLDDLESGQLACDTTDPANKRFSTFCGAWFYCGKDAGNQDGCTDVEGNHFECWAEKHALRAKVRK